MKKPECYSGGRGLKSFLGKTQRKREGYTELQNAWTSPYSEYYSDGSLGKACYREQSEQCLSMGLVIYMP